MFPLILTLEMYQFSFGRHRASTIGMESSAELTLNDGTSVMLSSDTEAMFEGPLGNSVTVRHGNLAAAVKPQAKNVPLLISTRGKRRGSGTQMLLPVPKGRPEWVWSREITSNRSDEPGRLDMNAGDRVEALSGEMRRVPSPPIPDSVAFRSTPAVVVAGNRQIVARESLARPAGFAADDSKVLR